MTIWLLEIEGHEQRYTSEWQTYLPRQLDASLRQHGSDQQIVVISGELSTQSTTPGAFLNFAGTNIFKSNQIMNVARRFENREVQPGDTFLVTDAWHPGIIQIRYMSDLLDIPVRIVGLWHSGSYDPADFLGRIPDKRWSKEFERALYYAIDVNCFATQFHAEMFQTTLNTDDPERVLRCGWPMEYLREVLHPYASQTKRDLILFPHRNAPEKQIEIFRDLARTLPEFEFVVCQEQPLLKAEYHQLLGEAKIIFSASLQETLGLGIYEGLLCRAAPLAPNRLSYAEMYPGEFLYPNEWTTDWCAYQLHKPKLVERLREAISNYGKSAEAIDGITASLAPFFTGQKLYEALLACPPEMVREKAARLPAADPRC